MPRRTASSSSRPPPRRVFALLASLIPFPSSVPLFVPLTISPLRAATATNSSGANVEDAFLETAKQIFQNIQDGSLDLNAAETGVQQRDVSNGALAHCRGLAPRSVVGASFFFSFLFRLRDHNAVLCSPP